MSRRQSDFALNITRSFAATLYWGPDEYLDALTLVLAVGHVKEAFEAVPYVLATSDRPAVGKSTLTKDIPLLLADRPWRVSRNTTVDALRNKWLEREAPANVLMDDAGKFFGEGGTQNKTTPLYQLAIDAYVRNATVSMSRNGMAQDMPCYAMFWMNGLRNAVPGDLATRAIQFRLQLKPPHIKLRSALSAGVQKEAEPLRDELHRWATSQRKILQRFMQADAYRVHPKLSDRTFQLWAPLFAIAYAAGGTWPRRCMDAFMSMALDEGSDKPVVQRDEEVLLDTAKIIMKFSLDRVFTAELVPALRELPSDFYREVSDQYLVEDLLPRALGGSTEMRGRSMDGRDVRGDARLAGPILEAAADLHDALYPPSAVPGPDKTALALTLQPVRPRR